jgi:fibronectin-binding autotransporter adhesin
MGSDAVSGTIAGFLVIFSEFLTSACCGHFFGALRSILATQLFFAGSIHARNPIPTRDTAMPRPDRRASSSAHHRRFVSPKARLLLSGLEDRITPNTFPVLNASDSGTGSFRDAISQANANPGLDVIVFDPTAFATPQTISLLTALPQLTDSIKITGPGSGLLAVQPAASATTSFNLLTVNGTNLTLDLSGMTLTLFKLSSISVGSGNTAILTDVVSVNNAGAVGILIKANSSVTGQTCVLANNTGYGLYGGQNSSISLQNCLITSNAHGGIVQVSGGLALEACTISNNQGKYSGGYGGGIFAGEETSFLLSDSTVSGNSAARGGGGIFVSNSLGGTSAGSVTIRNTTIAENTAASDGGGIEWDFAVGTMVIQNSTIADNTAGNSIGFPRPGEGGGIAVLAAGGLPPPTLLLQSTVVAANVGLLRPDPGPDIVSTYPPSSVILTADHSLIGVADNVPLSSNSANNLTGTLAAPLDPKLALATNNGGTTPTAAPLRGSPLLDAGSNPANLTTDQRGQPRVTGSAPDIGAVERTPGTPDALAGPLPAVTSAGGTSYQFTVTYSDAAAIDTSTLDGNDVLVTGPNGYSQLASLVGVSPPGNGSPLTATYSITPPGGSWQLTADGTYTISVQPNQVYDTGGRAETAGPLGAYTVAVPLTVIVTSLADSGPGTLRQAILDTNVVPAANTIQFDPSLFAAGPATINATGGLPTVSQSVTIVGPASGLLTMRAVGTNNGVFFFTGLPGLTVNLSGMTISGGQHGPGLYFRGDTATLADSVVTGNLGGVSARYGSLTLRNCTVAGNSLASGYGEYGAGIYAADSGLLIDGCTISSNSVPNIVNAAGGGVYVVGTSGPGGVTIRNSTIANNTAPAGGGVYCGFHTGMVLIQNSTIVGNTATGSGGGGGISAGGVILQSTIVANNRNSRAAKASDVSVSVIADHSLIGVNDGFTFVAGSALNYTGTLAAPLDPKLGPLQNNGGPTATMAPLPNSPTANRGSNSAGLAFDQTGLTPRRLGGSADIGAVESADPSPAGILTTPPALTVGATTESFTVTYTDLGPVSAASIDNGDVLITGPNGFSTFATVATPPTTDATDIPVTYQFTPPGGSWDWSDDGTYTITLKAGEVRDTSGHAAALDMLLATVPVTFVATPVVTNTADTTNTADPNYVGSLRWAIAAIDAASPTPSTITVAANVAGTINLVAALPTISNSVTLTGPSLVNAQPQLTIQRPSNAATYFGIFNIDGSTSQSVSISNLVVKGGDNIASNGTGGGITNSSANVTLTNMLITGNEAFGGTGTGGGGISSGGRLILAGDTITGNTSSYSGGGVLLLSGATLSVTNCMMYANSASANGGGICGSGSNAVTMTGTTLFGNRAASNGGAIWLTSTGTGGLTVADTTIYGNTANSGGGIALSAFASTALIQNSTITQNMAMTTSATAGQGGGGIAVVSATGPTSILLQSTVVSANVATNGRPDIAEVNDTNVNVAADHSLIGAADTIILAPTSTNNFAGTVANPLDPKLAPLGQYGGPTLTCAPLVGSPVLNTGSNPTNLPTDQRGFVRAVGPAADIGAVEYRPITVQSVQVNYGGAQRSEVRSITVTFSGQVNFAGFNAAAAFRLTHVQTGNNVILSAVVTTDPLDRTVVTLGFSGGEADPVSALNGGAASLADGRYQLTVLGAVVSDADLGWALDGDGDGTPGGNYVSPTDTYQGTGLHLYRLFGDVSGDGVVDATDLGQFRSTFNANNGQANYLSFLDADNSGAVDASDLGQFRSRFNTNVFV